MIKTAQFVNLIGGVEKHDHPLIKKSVVEAFGMESGGRIVALDNCKGAWSKNPDVIICFASAPGVIFDILEVAEDLGNPRIVMATTALGNAHLDALSDYSRDKAIAGVFERDPEEVIINGRKGMIGVRPEEEIGVHAIRGGDVVGEHIVYFLGQGERIMVAHVAHSKQTFARGAVRLAKWVMHQPPGMYNMGDYLGLNK